MKPTLEQYETALLLISKHAEVVGKLTKIRYISPTLPSHLMIASSLVGAKKGLMRELSTIFEFDLKEIPIELLEA